MAHCSLNSSASPQLTAEIKKPAQTEYLHANLMQCKDQAPAPTAGGDLARNAAPLRAGTLRVLCHACYTSRVSVHTLYVSPKCNMHWGRKLARPNLPCTRQQTSVQIHLAHRGCAPLVLRHRNSAAVAACHSRHCPSTRIAALLSSCQSHLHKKFKTQTEQLRLARPLILQWPTAH